MDTRSTNRDYTIVAPIWMRTTCWQFGVVVVVQDCNVIQYRLGVAVAHKLCRGNQSKRLTRFLWLLPLNLDLSMLQLLVQQRSLLRGMGMGMGMGWVKRVVQWIPIPALVRG